MRTPGLGESRFSSTSGVLPIAWTMSPYLPPHGRFSRPGGSIASESVAAGRWERNIRNAPVFCFHPLTSETRGEQLHMSRFAKTLATCLVASALLAGASFPGAEASDSPQAQA